MPPIVATHQPLAYIGNFRSNNHSDNKCVLIVIIHIIGNSLTLGGIYIIIEFQNLTTSNSLTLVLVQHINTT